MACVLLLVFLALSRLMLLPADDGIRNQSPPRPYCPPLFSCGKFREINFPFTTHDRPECGLFFIQGCDADVQMIQLEGYGPFYLLLDISQGLGITIKDETLERFLNPHDRQCESLNSVVFHDSPSVSFNSIPKLNLLKCNPSVSLTFHKDFNYTGCHDDYIIYYNGNNRSFPNPPPPPPQCSAIQLPAKQSQNFSDIFSVLTDTFHLGLQVSGHCYGCHRRGGECQTNNEGEFECSIGRGTRSKCITDKYDCTNSFSIFHTEPINIRVRYHI